MEIPISSRFHLVIDAFNCDSDKLGSKDELVKMIKDISELLNMKIISGPIVADGIEINPGLTAFAIIDFSHISIHTFTDKNEFCIKLLEINFEEDSIKITDKKPKEYVIIFCVLNVGSFLDFNINKSEIDIRSVIYIGFINLEYISL